jgi:hypothetical protein
VDPGSVERRKLMRRSTGTLTLPSLSPPPHTQWQGARPLLGTDSNTSDRWFSYDFEDPGQTNSLMRGPRWRCSTDFTEVRSKNGAFDRAADLAAKESKHNNSRRHLKKRLREERQNSRSVFYSMNLVGKSAMKDDPSKMRLDRARSEKSVQRIEGHLRDCSHARHELMEMQKKMALVCNKISDEVSGELHNAFAGVFKRKSTLESLDCIEGAASEHEEFF